MKAVESPPYIALRTAVQPDFTQFFRTQNPNLKLGTKLGLRLEGLGASGNRPGYRISYKCQALFNSMENAAVLRNIVIMPHRLWQQRLRTLRRRYDIDEQRGDDRECEEESSQGGWTAVPCWNISRDDVTLESQRAE